MNLETLVERARQGDTDAWSTLYQAYAGPMKGVCIRLLGRRDEAAEDLVPAGLCRHRKAAQPATFRTMAHVNRHTSHPATP